MAKQDGKGAKNSSKKGGSKKSTSKKTPTAAAKENAAKEETKKTIEDLQDQVKKLTAEKETLIKKDEKQQRALNDKQAIIDTKERNLVSANKRIEELEKTNPSQKQLQEALDLRDKKIEKLEGDIGQLTDDIEIKNEAIAEWKEEAEEQREKARKLRSQNKELETKVIEESKEFIGAATNEYAAILEDQIQIANGGILDKRFEKFQFKNPGDRVMILYQGSCYDNPKDLVGKDLRKAISEGKLDIYHQCLNYNINQVVYIPSELEVDKAIVDNLQAKKVMDLCLVHPKGKGREHRAFGVSHY